MASVAALKSKDVPEINKARAVIKGQITNGIKKLENNLSKVAEGDFDHGNISRNEIVQAHTKLNENLDLFQKLHLRYCEFREEGKDALTEDKLVEEDGGYLEEVESKVFPMLDKFVKYDRSFKAFEEKETKKQNSIDKIPELEKNFKRNLEVYQAAKESAEDIVKCLETVSAEDMLESAEIKIQPAQSMKQGLNKAFEDLSSTATELTSALESRGEKDTDGEEKVKFLHAGEMKVVTCLNIKLDKIISAQKLSSDSSRSVTQSPLNSTFKESFKATPIKINKPDAIKFTGSARDFASFKRDFEAIIVPNRSAADVGLYLKQAVPSKHLHLIANIDIEKHAEMMEVLGAEFGTSRQVVDSVVSDIEKFKYINSDKMFLEFVEKLEKINRDLKTVGMIEEVANATVIGKLESKLPVVINQEWTKTVINEEYDKKLSKVKFEMFMKFLTKHKEMVKYQTSEARQAAGVTKTQTQVCFVTGLSSQVKVKPPSNKTFSSKFEMKPCLACDDGATDINVIKHSMENCELWNSLKVKEKESKVKCKKHPFTQDHAFADCKSNIKACRICKETSHHFLLCPKRKVNTKAAKTAVSAKTKTKVSSSLETPVIVHALYVQGLRGRLGTLLDNCSTDNYITNSMAKKNKLVGEQVELMVEGIGGEMNKIDSTIYQVPVVDKAGQVHNLECYGMDVIATPADPPENDSYAELCSKFGIDTREVQRPRSIDLLISMRENHLLADTKLKTIGRMALYQGPLGKVFGGLDPKLKFTKYNMAFKSTKMIMPTVISHTMRAVMREVTHTHTAKTDKEILDFFKEESIGAECSPRCGGCQCGKCALGGRQMSIKDEKDYNLFLNHMTYDKEGTPDDPGPYWRISYPWTVPKEELVENKPAVIGVMNATAKKLDKDPSWRSVYEAQLKDLVKRGFAREVEEKEIHEHKKAGRQVYYIAHQMALNPSSKTTPVRTVFNCSQIFKGYSLNSSLALGPEHGLNSLHGVLIRFREGQVGAQGDITKQYYMIRIEPEDQMMQLWIWKFAGEDKIKTFCMTRVSMGMKPSANFAVIAMKETAKLEDFEEKYPVARKALSEDSYMDNTFVTAQTMAEIENKIEEVELVATQGGFKYKEWIISGQNVPEQILSVTPPNVNGVYEEKALGLHWDVVGDRFFVKGDVRVGSKKTLKKISVLPDVETDSADGAKSIKVSDLSLPIKLTLRICLSVHAKTCDPLGFVLPTKMIGTLLFRVTLQHMNQKLHRDEQKLRGKIPWDMEICSEFIPRWVEYFLMLDTLDSIMFSRSIMPHSISPDMLPTLVTFCDGNPEAFGAVCYAVWTLLDGNRKVSLLIAKAKMGPLQYKGETTRNELAGATFASRLKCWVVENTSLKFGRHVHFLDSMIVKDMVKKESYGYNTYAGLRVAEVQKKTCVDDWKHIPSAENISDILTKGARPDLLAPGSIWQCGPVWLAKEESEWPVTNLTLTADEKTIIQTYQNAGSKKAQCLKTASKMFQGSELDELIARSGDLRKLIRVTAYVLRLVGRTQPEKGVSRETVQVAVSAAEYHEAWMFLICWEQERRLDRKKHSNLILQESQVELLSSGRKRRSLTQFILSTRIRTFPVGFSDKEKLPVLPQGPLAKLVAKYYHDKYHADIDSTVAHIRNDVWIPRVRRLVSEVDKKCKFCLIKRRKLSTQLMGDLPTFRFEISAAFSAVCMDLFGPIVIKDDCVKKGPKIYKKVFGVLFTCTASRAVHLDVATDYSTEAVQHTIRRLMAVRGDIRLIISDPGSQLVGASKELSEWRKSWDQNQLDRFSATKGIEWRFIMAAAQHQNGAAESMIKFSKGVMKALIKSYGESKLTLNELNTLLAETANLVNERPIGVKPNSQTDSEYLSPNSLLLGRNSSRISSGPFQCKDLYDQKSGATQSRFLLVQRICDQFWKVWMKLYFPTLLWQQKWHHIKRNLRIGDICVLGDSGVFRGEWRLCRVTDTYQDRKGVVRNVEITVAPRCEGSNTYQPQVLRRLRRHVSMLIVIVPVEDQSDSGHLDDQHTLGAEQGMEVTEEPAGNVEQAGGELEAPENGSKLSERMLF